MRAYEHRVVRNRYLRTTPTTSIACIVERSDAHHLQARGRHIQVRALEHRSARNLRGRDAQDRLLAGRAIDDAERHAGVTGIGRLERNHARCAQVRARRARTDAGRHAVRLRVQHRVIKRCQALSHALVRERTTQEGCQVGALLRRQAQRDDVRILVRRSEVTAAVVEVDHLLDGRHASVVEEAIPQLEVEQVRNLHAATVAWIARDIEAAQVVVLRPHARIAEAIVRRARTGVAHEATALRAEHNFAAGFLRGQHAGHTLQELVERRLVAYQRALVGGNRHGDAHRRDIRSAKGLLEQLRIGATCNPRVQRRRHRSSQAHGRGVRDLARDHVPVPAVMAHLDTRDGRLKDLRLQRRTVQNDGGATGGIHKRAARAAIVELAGVEGGVDRRRAPTAGDLRIKTKKGVPDRQHGRVEMLDTNRADDVVGRIQLAIRTRHARGARACTAIRATGAARMAAATRHRVAR